MRELKFRVWYKYSGKMFEVFSFCKDYIKLITLSGTIKVPSSECTIMQFTGLHDKNGKEIYEGDIVQNEFGKKIVKWEHFGFCFEEEITKDCIFLWVLKPEKIEVIGNVYENSDLIE